MGFKKRAGIRKTQAKKATVTKLNQLITDEADRANFLMEQLHLYNDNVRGFNGFAGSCITDSMLFVKVWNRLGWGKAEPVCTDLAGITYHLDSEGGVTKPRGAHCTLWHKGHDGDDPKYPNPRSNPRYYQKGATGYDGHIIVKTPNFYLDPTLGQINRSDGNIVPISWGFSADEAKSIEDYEEGLQRLFTTPHDTTIRVRAHEDRNGVTKETPITDTFTVTIPMLRPQSTAPEKVAICQIPTEDNKHLALIAWAIRTDIDFETELAIHRRFFPTNDGWYNERKVHGRGLYAQVINTLTQLQKGVNN